MMFGLKKERKRGNGGRIYKNKMFNLIITERCNKNCTFCFTSKFARASGKYMSPEKVKNILDKFAKDKKVINILGGEPTLNPHFKEIVDEIIKRNKKILLISNFLFNKEILGYLLSLDSKVFQAVLANGSELDKLNRIDLFKNNYSKFMEIHQNVNLALSLTVVNGVDYEQYYNFLKDNLIIKRLRLGLDLKDKSLINNHQLGDSMFFFLKKYMNREFELNADCQIPFCIFKEELWDKYEQYLMDFCDCYRTCLGVAADLLPNGKVLYCFQTKDVNIDSDNFESYKNAKRELQKKYNKIMREKTIIPECEECDFYLSHLCNSLCLGCRKED